MPPDYLKAIRNTRQPDEQKRLSLVAATLFDRSHEAIMITDQDNRIIDVNPAFSRITGYHKDEVLGLSPSILSSGRHSREYYRAMWRTLQEQGHWRGEIWNRRKDGEEYAELLSISRVELDDPEQVYHVASFSDITTLKNHARELNRATHFDDLTGLPNRLLLESRINRARAHTDRSQGSFVLCYLDVDGFADVNAEYGHKTGDRILKALSERLTQALRSGDTVARTGGDEFVLLLQSQVDDSVFRRILDTINRPITCDGLSVALTASLGATCYPRDRADAEALIRHADQAMYFAKEKGRNQFHVFDPALDEDRRRRRDQLAEISTALEKEQFELYFQPQIRLDSGTTVGMEALIRWNHPEKGLIPPGQFLPTVENSHLEVPLGQWVVKEAIHQLNSWRAAGSNLSVSINISPQHLMDRSFLSFLESYLHSHPDLDPGLITLEVLESTALEDTQRAGNLLNRCREMGLKVALDDFGTGFSSLSYLRTLPVDLIKIDQSFVRSMLENQEDRAIVESVIFLAKRFAHPVLAEGTETPAHLEELRRMGCDEAQGYGIARPMPATEVLEWVNRGK